MRQEIGEKAEPEQAEREQEQAGQECQRYRGSDIGVRAGCGDLADGGRRHQRNHGDGPDRQRPAGAKQGIGDQRQDRGIESHLRRKAGQQCIGERLRDQHDGHDHRGDQIVDGRLAVVPPAPVKNRQVSCYAGQYVVHVSLRKKREAHSLQHPA